MLVLSRRPEQEIRFPNLGVTLRVLKIDGKVVKLGVEAPPDIKILRGEICAENEKQEILPRLNSTSSHDLRNRLNSISLAATLLQQQIEAKAASDADATLQTLVAELHSLDAALRAPDKEIVTPQRLRAQRVLIVEDDENERELLAGILRLNGCQVDTARDGLEALEYLDEHEAPDFVLLDMSMPRCSGPETIAMIRQNKSYDSLRVFAVSGHTAGEAGVRIGPTGVNDWFEKPLNPNRLLKRICDRTATC